MVRKITWRDVLAANHNIPDDWLYAAEDLASEIQANAPITVSRVIVVPDTERIHWNNIGASWTNISDAARAYNPSPHDGVFQRVLRLSGDVKLDDVDWNRTLELRTHHYEEREIKLLPGAVVSVFLIEEWSYHRRGFVGEELPTPREARVALWDHGEWMERKPDWA